MRLLIFQSTLRRTERHTAIATCLIVLNFNPRSGERSDWKARQDGRDCAISIHAPANGATGVVGAGASAFKFQSTLRRTERHHQHSIASDSIKFQSTLRRTERLTTSTRVIIFDLFQSTLRRTERPSILHIALDHCYFNPRSGERSDVVLDKHNVL